jgi:hypothetical protein
MYAILRLKVGGRCLQPHHCPTNFPEVSLTNITRGKADLYQVPLLGTKTLEITHAAYIR